MKTLDTLDPVRELSSMSALLEREFDRWLEAEATGEPATMLPRLFRRALIDPAREFLERPGKRFRGRLVTHAWAMSGGAPPTPAVELPLVVEILHAGSLIIDDIQDDSTTRRGAPALHHVAGTPTAINTANFFYCWPLDMLGRLGLPDAVTLDLYKRASSTLLRCHQGQALDLSVRVTDLAPDRVPVVVQSAATLKAGALMEFAASLGAGAAGGDRGKVEALGRFGRRLGVALQMFDDVSGITDPRRRDKGCEDLRLARLSWVWSWLAQTTDAATYERYRHEATEVAGGAPPGPLAAALRARMNGAREEIGRQLLAALDEVRPHVGDARHLDTLRAELDRLEQSYV